MKSRIAVLSAISLLFSIFSLSAQQAGQLDQGFEIKDNYGATFPIAQVWPLANGSLICFTEGGNFFSGRKTGSFFKLLPNGQLDTSYQAPSFTFQCSIGWCDCLYAKEIHVLPDGTIYLFCSSGIKIGETLIPQKAYRFSHSGNLQSGISDLNYYYENTSNQMVHLPGVGFLVLDNIYFPAWQQKFKILDFQLNPRHDLDSLVLNQAPNSFAEIWQSNGKKVAIQWVDSSNQAYYVLFDKTTLQFSAPVIRPRFEDKLGYPLGVDAQSRLYEILIFLENPNGTLYHQIIRRDSLMQVDSTFKIRLSDPSFGTNPAFRFLGNEIYLSNLTYPEFQLTRVYDSDTGAFLDSLALGNHRFSRAGNQLFLGVDSDNRFVFREKSPGGQTMAENKTHFGPSGPVNKVLAAENQKVFIVGKFGDYDGWRNARLAKVLPNGRVDSSFFCTQFQESSELIPAYLDFADNGQDLILINQSKTGVLNRFLYQIHPDGSIDPTFGSNLFADMDSTVTAILLAEKLPSGSWFLFVKFNSSTTYIIKIRSNGTFDPSFGMKSAHQFWPGNPGGWWSTKVLQNMSIASASTLKIGIRVTVFNQPPPCRPDKTNGDLEFNDRYFLMDTTGILLQSYEPFSTSNNFLQTLPNQQTGKATIYYLGVLPVFPGFYSWMFRLKENFEVDSGFKFRNYSDQPISSSLLPNLKPFSVTKNEEVSGTRYSQDDYSPFPGIFMEFIEYKEQMIKIGEDGKLDSGFYSCPFRYWVQGSYSTDTNKLYVYGQFLTADNRPAPYLVRLHDKPGMLTEIKMPMATPGISLFPNPTGNLAYFSGVKPGYSVNIFSAQGQFIQESSLDQNQSISLSGLPAGFYFWKVHNGSQVVGSGKLVKQQ